MAVKLHGLAAAQPAYRVVTPDPAPDSDRYLRVRRATTDLVGPLSEEDCVVQSMPDASPAKWHLAHTTWFFETFVLARVDPEYRPFDRAYGFLFNSYYNSVGPMHARPRRGMLTRPSTATIHDYRTHVDELMAALLDDGNDLGMRPVVELGLHHEQQHQELLLTDIKHAFSYNPLKPAYQHTAPPGLAAPPMRWHHYGEGMRWIGAAGDGFAFDNEGPYHRRFVEAFELASRPVTNGEFAEFIADDGYRRPELWLSDGWQVVNDRGWQAPLYWERHGGDWRTFTLAGMQPVDPEAPVCHVSLYEADAFARWARARLPTEAEWEVAADGLPVRGNLAESGYHHPTGRAAPPSDCDAPVQMFGDVWEWTASAYSAYPGYRPPTGALGEYNGKFMSGQMVLRGGSCVTPRDHARATYRNFFPPDARWQFAGLRLARDA